MVVASTLARKKIPRVGSDGNFKWVVYPARLVRFGAVLVEKRENLAVRRVPVKNR